MAKYKVVHYINQFYAGMAVKIPPASAYLCAMVL